MEKHKEKKKKNKKDRKTGEHNVIKQSEEIEVNVMDINKDHDMEEIRAEEKNELRKIEKHKEKKKKMMMMMKDRETDKSNAIEQSEEIEVDATDVNKDHDMEKIKVASKKHDKKKNRCSEAEYDPTVLDGRGLMGRGVGLMWRTMNKTLNWIQGKIARRRRRKRKSEIVKNAMTFHLLQICFLKDTML